MLNQATKVSFQMRANSIDERMQGTKSLRSNLFGDEVPANRDSG